MLAQARVKTITVHTRKEAIVLLEQLKNIINKAYDSESPQAICFLLTIVKTIYYLAPLPRFLNEINNVGTLPVTGFLQNLLVKFRMNKTAHDMQLLQWISVLLSSFKKSIPSLNLKQIKGLQEFDSNTQEFQWNNKRINQFISSSLELSYEANDAGLFETTIIMLRNFLVFIEGLPQAKVEWNTVIKYLSRGCWILNNIAREQTAISINYYLCLKQQSLCSVALDNGAIAYLLQTLSSKFISESLGKRIIQFLRYLIFSASSEQLRDVQVALLEETLSKFIVKHNKSASVSEVRTLMCLLNQKMEIPHEQRLEKILGLFQSAREGEEQQIFNHLSIVALYARAENMSQLLLKHHQKFISYMLTAPNQILVKMLVELMSFVFKNGKMDVSVGEAIIGRVFQIVSDDGMRERLNAYRKRVLIDFVKALTQLLENREHQDHLSLKIRKVGLDKKLWEFSDCTNYEFERMMIVLTEKLGEHSSHESEGSIFYQLQQDFMEKSQASFSKPTPESCEQIALMDQLFSKGRNSEELSVHPDLPATLVRYIHPFGGAGSTVLGSLQLQEKETLRKRMNLVVCRFLVKLMKVNADLSSERGRLIELAASADELEDVGSLVHKMLTDSPSNEQQNQSQSNEAQVQYKIKQLAHHYFQAQQLQPQFVLDLSEQQLLLLISEMQNFQNEQNLLKYLRLLLYIGKNNLLCLEIFLKLGSNLASMYSYILSDGSEPKRDMALLLESLLIKLIKLHIELYFSDQYMEANYWLQIIDEIDCHFQVFFSKKRILLLDLILEYMDMNKILDHQQVSALLNPHPRKQLIAAQALKTNGETLGFCCAILLYCWSSAEVETLALHHKQNVSLLLRESCELVSTAKFAAFYYLRCEQKTFRDFMLEDWAQRAVTQLSCEMKRVQIIVSNVPEAALKLRRVSHFAQVLHALNQRKDFSVGKSLLLAQEDALLCCLKYLVYYIDMFQAEQFKRYYLGQIITNILTTLVQLYRNNFKLLPVRGGDTIQHFDALMAINSDQIKDSVCEMMRVLLLKREVRMIHCQTLPTCKQYRQSLPAFSQQHIYYCQRIEHILCEEGDLQPQIDTYFQHTPNNTPLFQDHPTAIPIPSAYLIPDQSQPDPQGQLQIAKKVSIDFEDPLILELASQPEIPHDQEAEANLTNKEQQESQQLVSLTQIQSNSVSEEGANRQGEFEGSTQIIQLLEKQWDEQEAIEKIELYLNNPQSIDLKLLSDNLAPFSSKKYYSILLQLFLKARNNYSQGKINSKVNLRNILGKIISCLPTELCEPSEELYQILASGLQGASLGLRYKGTGMRGIEIYAKKFMSSLDLEELSLYAQLLRERRTFEQLKFLKNCKIHEVVHEKLSYFTTANHPLTHICSLIAETCKYPPLCNAYQIVPEFCINIMTQRLQPSSRRPLLHALKCLCRGADKHKKQIQNTDFLSELLKLLVEEGNEEVATVAELLVMGAEDNIEVSQFYQNQKLEEKVLAMLHRWVRLPHYQYELYINALKILELLATLPLSAPRIIKGGIMSLCKPIAELAVKGGHYDVVGVSVSILRNLIQELQLILSRVLGEMEREGLLEYLLMAGEWLARCRQVQSYLCIFARLVTSSAISKKILQRVENVLRVLNQLARDQLSSQSLVEQWLKVVFLLAEANRYSALGLVLKSNVFFSAASCLRTAQGLSQGILAMNKRMMRQLGLKMEMRGLLAFHGYANFLVELLRAGGLSLEDYLKVLSFLSDLFKHRHFTSKLCTQLFAVVMGKLETNWKDEVATASITLLKSIRKSVEVTHEFGAMMLEFFGKFLTQSAKISSAEYYSVSREVVCLLSFFLVFNEDIRSLFRSRLVMDILKNWLRIAKAMDYTDMPQSYKLFLYAVYCEENLYMDLCDVNSRRVAEAEVLLQRGWRCKLYRLNGTYKQAILRMDKSKVQLVAFKAPDGIIKEKYRLHFKELLIVHRYTPQSHNLFAESSFTKAINPFQHTVKPEHCLTLLCLTAHSFEVKEISIEVEKIADLQQIYNCTKVLASRWAQSQIQEQSRVWQLVNQKVL